MKPIRRLLIPALWALMASAGWSQQANVNIDWNPHQNTENLRPFSAAVNSPEVHDDRTVTFRVKAPQATDGGYGLTHRLAVVEIRHDDGRHGTSSGLRLFRIS